MKLAILSDVHANLQALEAVLADASSQGAEGYLSLGDHIGFNGDPAACLNLLMPLLSGAVQGNHEAALLQRGVFRFALFVRMMNRTAAMLSREQKKWLGDLPLTTVREGLRLLHAPKRGKHWMRITTTESAAGAFSLYPEKRLFTGHTHRPALFRKTADGLVEELGCMTPAPDCDEICIQLEPDSHYLINPGSVGQPRDGDPRAAYALYDTETDTLQLRRLPYDVEQAIAGLARTGMPASFADALRSGTSPTGD